MIPSPCIGVCTMEGEYCAGCLRTEEEIGQWHFLTDEQKREHLRLLDERREALAKKKDPRAHGEKATSVSRRKGRPPGQGELDL